MPEWITDIRAIIAIVAAVGGIGYWIGQVNTDRKSFKEFMKELKNDVGEIRNDIKSILSRLSPPIVAGKSPIQLTEYGKELAEKASMHQVASRLAPILLDSIGDFETFEVHDFCLNYARSELPETEERQVSKGAFEAGASKDDIRLILAILLRNELLRLMDQEPETNP